MIQAKSIASLCFAITSLAALGAKAAAPGPVDSEVDAGAGQSQASHDLAPSSSEPAPLQLAVWSSLQVVDTERAVYGLKLNLPYGSNEAVHGLDLGIASHTRHELLGAQFGLGGYVAGDLFGVQYNPIVSITKGRLTGWQEGIYASAGSLQGVQTGFVNYSWGSVEGLQLGAVNVAGKAAEGASLGVVNVMQDGANGFQLAVVNVNQRWQGGAALGVVNYAPRVDGLQLGLVNVTGELHGVQIGLANIASNGWLPFMPIVNAAM